jgi:hypothetical protein
MGRLVGVLSVPRLRREFTPADVELLRSVADWWPGRSRTLAARQLA